MKLTLKLLGEALLNSWDADTAKGVCPEQIPAMNQCAVTALVVQDYFGGELKRQKLNDGDSHYWNDIPYFSEVDMTFSQFAITRQYGVGEVVTKSRDYVLSFPDTAKRYELLKGRVEEYINAHIS